MTKRRDFIRKSVLGTSGLAIGSFAIVSGSCKSSGTEYASGQNIRGRLPRQVIRMTEEYLGRKPLNLYGGYEDIMQMMRSYRPLDLNAPEWRKNNPRGGYEEWAKQARECLMNGLHYPLPSVDLQAETLDKIETDLFIRERIEFNTTPWFRVPGYFYIPKNVALPAPALIVLHEWGGPMLFGADRICGDPIHPAIVKHREGSSSGRPLADWFASNG